MTTDLNKAIIDQLFLCKKYKYYYVGVFCSNKYKTKYVFNKFITAINNDDEINIFDLFDKNSISFTNSSCIRFFEENISKGCRHNGYIIDTDINESFLNDVILHSQVNLYDVETLNIINIKEDIIMYCDIPNK